MKRLEKKEKYKRLMELWDNSTGDEIAKELGVSRQYVYQMRNILNNHLKKNGMQTLRDKRSIVAEIINEKSNENK